MKMVLNYIKAINEVYLSQNKTLFEAIWVLSHLIALK